MIPSKKSKAIGLFSGGLDSILATKLISEQGVTVLALHFRSPFEVPGRVPSEDRLQKLAATAGAALLVLELGDDYLDLVRQPKQGYVRQMAPCVDCIIFMLAKAKELAKEIRADFLFTGEVAGQRAICQNKRALKGIEKAAGLEGRLLRPLSAKLLEPTIPELTGLVRRERLLDIKGRSRRRQMRLAHEYGIFDFPIPGTGCMLLDRNYAAKARDAVAQNELTLELAALLRHGRHFRLDSGARVVVGRNEGENAEIEKLARETDVLCRPVDVMGPVVLYRSAKVTKKDTELAARLCARYSDTPHGKSVKIACAGKEMSVKPFSDADIAEWRIKAAESTRRDEETTAQPAKEDKDE
ncbi:MAG: tRNA 4-thiouridine(8) synthase ThiI [bacterium]